VTYSPYYAGGWKDDPDHSTPIVAAALQNIEDGISAAGDATPMTTLGDITYEDATPAPARLAGTTSATKHYLTQTGTGSVSAAPAWGTIAAGDVPTLNQNTTGTAANITDTLDQVPAPAANVSLNSHKITGLADGTASTDAAAFGQIPVADATAADFQPLGVAAAGSNGKWSDSGHVHPYEPWQFLPEAYGAVGDGKVLDDVVTNGTTTITSATAAFTSGDVGKYIMIHGALGATSAPLMTTIASVTNSTTAVLTSGASASTSNCPAVYGTDDTSAIQSAVTAAGTYATAHSYFAEVIFGAKIYIVGTGPTQTGNGSSTPTFNAQVTLPYPNANGATQKLIIALTGAGDNGHCQYWESLVPNVAGTALVSMTTAPGTPSGTYGNQSVIGGPSSAAGFTGGYANVKVAVKGLAVWCPIFTNQYAYDFGFVSDMRVEQSSAHIFAPTGVNGGVQPYLNNIASATFQSSIGTGFRAPVTGNNDDVVMDDVCAEGYECAFRIDDHFVAGRMAAIYSDVAMVIGDNAGAGTSHGVFIGLISAEVYNGGLLCYGGTCQIDIGWDAECSGPTYDLHDNNAFKGVFRFRDPAGGRTPVVTSGHGANVKVINDELGPGYWSGAPSVPATTVAQQNTAWRDALVVITSGGAAVTEIDVDGQATGATLGSSGSVTIPVPAGKNITLTYASTAPTWVWYLL
jgi:hypothetical protein